MYEAHREDCSDHCVVPSCLNSTQGLRHEHNKARALGYRGIGESTRVSALDDDDDDEGRRLNGGRESFGDDEDGIAMITQDIGHGEEHEEFEFSEIMIHQIIHTIGKQIVLFAKDTLEHY